MTFVLHTTGEGDFSDTQIRNLHKTSILPTPLPDTVGDYSRLTYTPVPTPADGYRVEKGARELIDDKWTTTWVSVEMTPEEIEAARKAKVPQSVSRFQARAVLHAYDLLETVNTMMETADPIAKLAWQDAQEFRRTSPTVLAMAGALALSDLQLDEMFVAAAGIEA